MADRLETAPEEEAAAERRFLTFRLDERLYAVPAEAIREVVPVPPVARLPQSPKSLLGLANLRGAVLPVVSLRALLGLDAVTTTESVAKAGRAIVLEIEGAAVALAVDAVAAFVALAPGSIDRRHAALAEAPGERVSGAFQAAGHAGVAKILDVPAMLGAAFTRRALIKPMSHDFSRPAAMPLEAAEEQVLLVTFGVAGQEYALPLGAVQEIVPLPATLATVPRAEAVLLGVAPYRDGLIPLLSLRLLLGFAAAAPERESERKVVVAPVRGILVGLVADRMRAIIRADASEIEPTPPMLAARTGGEARIKSIYRGQGGRHLVSVLAPEQLFREDVMQRLGDTARFPDPVQADRDRDLGETLQFLVFRLGDEEFALPVGAVDEVARVPDRITRLPKTPAFLEGVTNLRGEVLPVVDQRKRFDMPPFQIDARGGDGRRLIAVRTDRHRAGLIVDSVVEVLRAPAASIAPPPELADETTSVVIGVINLPGGRGMVLLLDPTRLLSQAEQGLLDTFDAGSAGQEAS